MIRKRLILAFVFLLPLVPEVVKGDDKVSFSLKESYALALERSEALQISETQIEIAEAEYRKAISLLYPRVHFQGVQRLRGNSDFGSLARFGDSGREGGEGFDSDRGRGASLGITQFETFISLQQPLFNGFRDYLLSRAAESNIRALRLELKRSRELLFLDVAELYCQIALYTRDLEVLRATDKVLEERIKELARFIELGKSKEGEVLAARAELAELKALNESVVGSRDASHELLAFLVGRPAKQLSLVEMSALPLPASLDEYLERGRERTDLRALKERAENSFLRVKAAEREGWPSLSLEGNAYPYEDPDRQRDWEILVRFSIPLSEGGRLDARIAEERARGRLDALRLGELTRRLESDIRVAHASFRAAEAEFASLRKLREATERNYQIQRRDYELGVVTNLEVLDAIRRMQVAQRKLIDAETRTYLNRIRLDIAAGEVEL